MWVIRYFEDRVKALKAEGAIAGSVHLCSGQEAIYTGACAALDLPRDAVFCTYRGHGWALGCGVSAFEMFSEMLGRATGTNGGRGGSAYLSSPSHGMWGENSIVGAGAPIAAGAALAARYDGSERVVLTAFGDGAVNQGSVHEALNFASLLALPLIVLVENNRWSELTPTDTMVTNDRLFKRASAYGITSARIDGNNVVAVQKAVTEAARRARSGAGPVLLEAMTERLEGHYIGDALTYRSREENERMHADEPLARLTAELATSHSTTELDDIRRAALSLVEEAAAAALAAPTADPATAEEHLYA
ncbi:MAG: thiamine pyrophosphate-dependent dehydrogenase E1 component subunit alpha [Herbiconiux sp.]|nr:MAG: thiamine pyrophosphate-dependent dehydrogenase E1 component subunit alpha [Herbiconiux sp.]